MNDSWTIVLTVGSSATVAQAVRALHPKAALNGTELQGPTLEVPLHDTRLVISTLERVSPGDRFSQLVLGMHNFTKNLAGEDAENKQSVLDAIANARLLLGVVARPKSSELIEGAVFRLAKELSGFVFNGNSFCDGEGNLLLGT